VGYLHFMRSDTDKRGEAMSDSECQTAPLQVDALTAVAEAAKRFVSTGGWDAYHELRLACLDLVAPPTEKPAVDRGMRFDSFKLGYTRKGDGLAVHYPRHEAGNVTYGAGFAFDPHPEIIAKPDSERGRLWREMLTPGRDGDRNPKGEDPKGLSAKHESAVPSGNRRESPL
jgi:hypothetical protein